MCVIGCVLSWSRDRSLYKNGAVRQGGLVVRRMELIMEYYARRPAHVHIVRSAPKGGLMRGLVLCGSSKSLKAETRSFTAFMLVHG